MSFALGAKKEDPNSLCCQIFPRHLLYAIEKSDFFNPVLHHCICSLKLHFSVSWLVSQHSKLKIFISFKENISRHFFLREIGALDHPFIKPSVHYWKGRLVHLFSEVLKSTFVLFSVCPTELNAMAEWTHQPHPGVLAGCNPLPPLCILPMVRPFPAAQTPAGATGNCRLAHCALPVLCAAPLCIFPIQVGSTHQSALQLHHWEFFIRSKLS